jgi:hypothetical protein
MNNYKDDDPIEIILGICDKCVNYVPFVRVPDEELRVYKCMTCKTKHTQHVNGKVVFNYLEDSYIIRK